MSEYHKIHSVYKRDKATNKFTGEYSRPEFAAVSVWQWTEKIDGMNIRIYLEPDKDPVIQGRTDRAVLPADLVAKILSYDLKALEGPLTLYGEGFGPGIQRGTGYDKYPRKDFILFDVKDSRDRWISREGVVGIGASLGMKVVKMVFKGILEVAINSLKGKYDGVPVSALGDWPIEGYIGKPLVELQNVYGERVITKLKVRDFQ